jgi:hypothetical protein
MTASSQPGGAADVMRLMSSRWIETSAKAPAGRYGVLTLHAAESPDAVPPKLTAVARTPTYALRQLAAHRGTVPPAAVKRRG